MCKSRGQKAVIMCKTGFLPFHLLPGHRNRKPKNNQGITADHQQVLAREVLQRDVQLGVQRVLVALQRPFRARQEGGFGGGPRGDRPRPGGGAPQA